MKLDEAIEKRHSVRKFTTKKPNWRDIIEALDAARLAPSAGNIQTLRFILVDDKEKIKKIAEACQQQFIADSYYVVVFCSDPSQAVRMYDERALRYVKQQAGAAIQNFLLKITELGLATCWVGAFVDNQIKDILQIPKNIEVEAVFPIGYELGKSEQRKKRELSGILFFNRYGNKYMKEWVKTET
ncbi:MAG: nitroreductase family protein [Candidatus Pacearchaeota archaeon]